MAIMPGDRAIEGEHVESLRVAVLAAGERWSSGQRDLIRLVTALDISGEWAGDGAATCAHWIAERLDIETSTAREWLRIGRALKALDVLDDAFADGRLSYAKVRGLTRVATAANQAELCELALRVPASRLGHAVAAWLQHHESPAETEERHHAVRGLRWRLDIDGTGIAWLRLPPAELAVITSAVDAQVVRRRPDDASADASYPPWPSIAQQRADALVNLVRNGGATTLTEVVMHVRGDGCTLDDGMPIADTVVERIAPDAFLRALIHDAERRPINASGRQRHPTARQRRVIRERDRHCVDCGATELLQYDHDPPYEQTRRTLVEEVKLRCAQCHHSRHRKDVVEPMSA
jgi:5-methylcytosine-specific restriction endonuclease McrA